MSHAVKFVGACFASVLLYSTAGAAEKVKKRIPNRPIPTEAELGFIDITRDELRTRIKRIGLASVRFPPGFEDREDANQAIIAAASRILSDAGFAVVGPARYQALHDQFNRQLGGIYDPHTGAPRPAVAKTVGANARREFVAAERLDGLLLLTVTPRPAAFAGDHVSWDGVKERGNNAGTGVVTGLSLQAQLLAGDRVVFTRFGGIQLVSYGIPARGFEMARVPIQDLLRDTPRLERATRVATLPLVRSPKQILYGFHEPTINAEKIDLDDLPAPPAARKAGSEPALKVPRDQLLGQVNRVVITPVSSGVAVPAEAKHRIESLVREELAALGWQVLDSEKLRAAMLSQASAGAMFDPLTGRRDDARIAELRQSLFSAPGGEKPDAVVWVRVIRTTPLHRAGDVEWDGVNQNVFTRGPVIRGKGRFGNTAHPYVNTGIIDATSLSIQISDPNDTVLYDGRGGLHLMQTMLIKQPHPFGTGATDMVDLDAGFVFTDSAREKPAVQAALRELSMTPEALRALLNPEPARAKTGSRRKSGD